MRLLPRALAATGIAVPIGAVLAVATAPSFGFDPAFGMRSGEVGVLTASATFALTVLVVGFHWIGVDGVSVRRRRVSESVRGLERPGAELRLLDGDGRRFVGRRERRRVRVRLRALAVTNVAAERRCTRETAERALDAGTWTDDAVAAAFFVAEPAGWLRRPFEAWRFSRRARRTALVVADDAEVE